MDTAKQPFRSSTWIAALSVILDRDGGDLPRTRRLGPARFEHAVRRLILRRGVAVRVVAWLGIVATFGLTILGPTFRLPAWALDISPLRHVPTVTVVSRQAARLRLVEPAGANAQ